MLCNSVGGEEFVVVFIYVILNYQMIDTQVTLEMNYSNYHMVNLIFKMVTDLSKVTF